MKQSALAVQALGDDEMLDLEGDVPSQPQQSSAAFMLS